MNTYLIPCFDGEELWIESVSARTFSEAQNKLMKIFEEDFDIEVPCDWEDLIKSLAKINVVIGDLYDITEF